VFFMSLHIYIFFFTAAPFSAAIYYDQRNGTDFLHFFKVKAKVKVKGQGVSFMIAFEWLNGRREDIGKERKPPNQRKG
jgi:hypothetical protein